MEHPVAFADKVDGYMAVKDFLEGNLREEELTVKAVEYADAHPKIKGARYFLRFKESDETLVINRINEGVLRNAYGKRWSGRKILLRPTHRVWFDGTLVWGLEVVPLVRCGECRANFTVRVDIKMCEICEVIAKWKVKTNPRGGRP